MKVNLWSPQWAGSIRAYIDCSVQGENGEGGADLEDMCVAAGASLIYLAIVVIVHALQARWRDDGAHTHAHKRRRLQLNATAMRHAGPQGAQFYPVPN